MTETAPVPPHLLKGLSTRARTVLIKLEVKSHQDLIALSERGLPKTRRCGTKTTAELKLLLERVRLGYVQLLSSLAEPSDRDEDTATAWDDPEIEAPRTAPAPPEWSILHRTLSELFAVAASPSHCAWPETIRLPPADLERLRAIGIFPEDTPFLLYSYSIDYLLEARLSDTALSAMLHALARISQLPGDALPTPAAEPADLPLYAELPPGLLDPLVVPEFPFPGLLDAADAPTEAVSWSAVAKITERTVTRRLGFSVTALRAIRYLWQLKERTALFAESAAAGMPTALYLDFDQLLASYVQVTQREGEQNPKHLGLEHRLTMDRLGPNPDKVSLRELGADFGISRERVRQIEAALLKRLRGEANIWHLGYLWGLLDHLIRSGGGARYASELCLSLQSMHGLCSPPSEETLTVLTGLSPRYRVVPESSPIRIALTAPSCVGCARPSAAVIKALTASEHGALSFHHTLEVMRDACQNLQCPELRKITSFSLSLVEFLADSAPTLRVDYQAMLLELPQHKYPSQEDLEEILLSAPDGMHFSEAHRRLKLLHPDMHSTAHNVHGRLAGARWSVLWGPGTFIHRAYLSIPVRLIQETLDDFASLFDPYDVPYLCVNGHHFDRYADRLRSEGVPTSRAFYSCMKIVGSPTMSFDEFPYVLRKGHAGPRPTVSMLLEQFVAKAQRAVSCEELYAFGVGKLGVPMQQAPNHVHQARNILRIGRLMLHIDNVQFITDQLRLIVGAPPTRRGKFSRTEAALFNKHRDACGSIGMTGAKDLFRFVERFLPGKVNWRLEPDLEPPPRRRPSFKYEDKKDAPDSAPVTSAPQGGKNGEPPVDWVYAYLEDLGKPCPTKHLFGAFRAEPQHNALYKRWLGNAERVLWYTRDSVIARNILDWNDEKQYAIEALALMHMEQAGGRIKPYGSCCDIYRDCSGELPELAQGIAWTPVLLHGLLVSGENFVHVGRQKDLFVSVDNPHGIQTLNDLLCHVLQSEHGGCAPKKEFMAACEKEGISLKPSALFLTGKDPRVVIDGDVIRVAGLEAGA